MQKSNSTEEQPKEKKEKLPQHTDEGSLGGKTGFDFFRYFTFLFLNISILRKYIMKNCKLRFVFPNSLNLYILDLQAMKILIRLMLHTKMDLNLHLVKRSSRAVNFFECFRDGNLLDKSCCYWFTYSKSFFQNIILIFLFTYSLCSSFYHFLHYIGPKKDFATTVK